MDDKELDKIMRDYVSGISNNKEVDLKKLNAKSANVRKNSINKLYYGFALIMVVVMLSIVFPIILNNNVQHSVGTSESTTSFSSEKVDSTTYYYNEAELIYNKIESLDMLGKFGFENYLVPKVEAFENYVQIISDKKNSDITVGTQILFLESGNLYNEIKVVFHKIIYNLDIFANYDVCCNELKWNDIDTKSAIGYNKNLQVYSTKICFMYGEYKYYIEAKTYEEIAVTDILDYIYKK